MSRTVILALLAAGLAAPQPAAAQAIGDSRAPSSPAERAVSLPPPLPAEVYRPRFGGHAASGDVRRMAAWITTSGDNRDLPFMIVDKRGAQVFLFDPHGLVLGAAPALLGLGLGDHSVAGIGQRRLASMAPGERTTPAGRFESALGHDLEQDVLWIDYDAALSLHRVITGSPGDRRRERLASPTAVDNRVSYGCINVPASFYDTVVKPAFKSAGGIVYILPETQTLESVFAIKGEPRRHGL
jgi:hypothetical protein